MKQRILRETSLGKFYVESKYTGKNEAGIEPIGDNCLILIDDAAVSSAGGIDLPDDMRERLKMAAETGVIVAVGDGAFTRSADRSYAFSGRRPQAGDRVYFTRFSGVVMFGNDGLEYRCMTDTCIGGIEPNQQSAAS